MALLAAQGTPPASEPGPQPFTPGEAPAAAADASLTDENAAGRPHDPDPRPGPASPETRPHPARAPESNQATFIRLILFYLAAILLAALLLYTGVVDAAEEPAPPHNVSPPVVFTGSSYATE